MILRPDRSEIGTLLFFQGRVALLLGGLASISALVSLLAGENTAALRLGTGAAHSLFAGLMLANFFREEKDLSSSGSLALVALVWIFAMFLVGWTYFLTGQYGCFTDACFDAMSGFTTTGLVLIQDLDHAPEGLNFLRHLVTFVGGQGIIVLLLAILAKDSPLFFQLYVGEGKDERLWPNVLHSARSIWKISVYFLGVGTLILGAILFAIGLSPGRAFLDAFYLIESSWSTGGFAPHSQGILYYHSAVFEFTTILFFVLGSVNFLVHYQVFQGKFSELFHNTEVRTFAFSVLVLTLFASLICARQGVYDSPDLAFKKVLYQVISGHSTTGHMTVYARQFINDWPVPATLTIILSMMIGASACSTAGGIKCIRTAMIGKGILYEIKKNLLPARALTVVRFFHGQSRLISPAVVYRSFLIAILFVGLYGFCTLAGVLYGYPLLEAFFEGVSAASNSGLSCGITGPAMPWGLKITYIIAMWLGRLEFMAVLLLIGYLFRWLVGK